MSFSNSKLAFVVVWGQVVTFAILVTSLCLTLFYKNYSDPVVLVALIGLTGTLAGNLGSILGGPQRMTNPTPAGEVVTSTTQTTTTVKPPEPPPTPPPSTEPTPVVIKQPETDPVPVTASEPDINKLT